MNEEHESLESVFLSTLEHDVTPVENEASGDVNDADSAAGEQPSSHLIQRAVVYGTLVIFLLVALNDYRLRTAWESEYQTLADSLIHSKGLPQETSTPELVELMATRKGVDSWLEKRGYELTKDRSSHKLRVFAKSSGIRQFWVVVDYHVGGTEESPVLTTINFTPESHYFWELQDESPRKKQVAKPIPVDPSGEGGSTTIQGGTPMGGTPGMSGGGSGQGGRGNGGQRRNFNPEERFSELDTNGDEILKDDEITERLRDNLERFDGDSDGQVTKEEFLDAMAAIMAAARESRNQGTTDGAGAQRGGGRPASPGQGGGLYDVPDDPGEQSDEDPNRLPNG